MNNRRHFLRSIVIVGAALTARPLSSWARGAAGAGDGATAPGPNAAGAKHDPLSQAAFAGALGSTFALAEGGSLVLDTVSELARCAHTESFSVWLRQETGPAVVSGTHVFEHAQLGRFEMFVVPKTQVDGSHGCEAIFNRLVA